MMNLHKLMVIKMIIKAMHHHLIIKITIYKKTSIKICESFIIKRKNQLYMNLVIGLKIEINLSKRRYLHVQMTTMKISKMFDFL